MEISNSDIYNISFEDYCAYVSEKTEDVSYNFQLSEIVSVRISHIFPNYRAHHLYMNGHNEWNCVDSQYPVSDNIVEVGITKYGSLVIVDGHHRVKAAIYKGCANIKVKIVALKYSGSPFYS